MMVKSIQEPNGAIGCGAYKGGSAESPLIGEVRVYWNTHIHDLEITTHPVGTKEFFQELEAYRFEKLEYLPRVVDFSTYRGKQLLEVGCGVGLDLARFAHKGAHVTGIDLSETAITLARANMEQQGLKGTLSIMNGEALQFDDHRFDIVYAHGVLPYTPDATRMIREIHRVLKPGGKAILMVYNRFSWLMALSKLARVELEHRDAPVLRTISIRQYRALLEPFAKATIIPERFPVPTRLHHGPKAVLYNHLFVGAYQSLPRALVRPLGWHLMAFATKGGGT